MGRAPCCEKVGLKKGRWTAEEDDTLTKYIQANGEGSWRSLPKNAGLLRCGKSCRLRWINYLRIDLKRGNISTREEDIIIKLHASLGNKWSLIAGQLPGRTDNEIKNYWNSHLSRKIDTFRRPNSEPLPLVVNLGTNTNASKKKGGRTSRAAMKKNKMSYTRTTNNIGKSSASMVQENGNLENKGIVVSLPSTHTLEKETLPSALIMSWQEEKEKERRNLGMLSSYQEGILGSRDQEINNSVLSNGGEEKREGRNLMVYCPTDDDQQTSELLGPHEGLESGLLSFYDINMCSDDQMPNPNRALLSSNEKGEQNKTMVSVDDQQRESGVVSYCLSKIATSEDQESRNLSSNGESSGEWLSCTSTISYLEDGRIDWEWEGLVHENLWNNEQDQEQHQQEQEEMLSWLWDTDNIINGEGEIQNLGEGMESAKQEALVAWLLS